MFELDVKIKGRRIGVISYDDDSKWRMHHYATDQGGTHIDNLEHALLVLLEQHDLYLQEKE